MMQSPLQQSVRGTVRVWMEHWPGGAKVMETARGQASLPRDGKSWLYPSKQ